MDKRNEKGGSMGSQRSNGSNNSNSKGPGEMNTGSASAAGSARPAGTGSPVGSTGSSGLGNTTNRNIGENRDISTKTGTGTSKSYSGNNDGKLPDLGGNTNKILTALGVVAGGALLYKGAKALTGSGKSATVDKKSIVDINTILTVKRPKEELYAYWRNLENLPNFMSHIEEVHELSDKRSEWTAKIPGGLGIIEWEAEIIWDQKNHSIAWRSLPDSEIENSGEVRFQDAGNGKRTIVEARISYRPPAGEVGGMAAKLLNPAFKKVVENDLQQFKKVMEKGGASKRSSSRV